MRLPRAAQLAPVPGLPPVDASMAVPRPASIEPDKRIPSPFFGPSRDPLSSLKEFVIAITFAALLAGYFVFSNSHHQMNVATAPQPATIAQVVPSPAAEGIALESRAQPEVETTLLPPAERLKISHVDNQTDARAQQTITGTEERSGQTSETPQAKPDHQASLRSNAIERGEHIGAASVNASNCFPSASAVRLDQPRAWPSWTLRAHGHEGTRCWYAATRATARDHKPGPSTMKSSRSRVENFPVVRAVLDRGHQSKPPSRPSAALASEMDPEAFPRTG